MAASPAPQFTALTQRMEQASGQIDQSLEIARRTGNVGDVVQALDGARRELEAVHEEWLKLQKTSEASFAILRAGDCLRISSRWNEAIADYEKALAESRQSANVEVNAKAWLGLERAQRLGLHNHQAAAEAIRQGLLILERKPDLWKIRVDLLGERAELELEEGELENASKTIGLAIAGSEEHADKDRLWVNLYSRSSIHHNLADIKRQQYLNLPFDSPKAWDACNEAANEVRAHLQDAVNDTERASRLSGELGQEAFARNLAAEAVSLKELQKAFEDLAKTKEQAYNLLRAQVQPQTTREPLMATNEGKPIPASMFGPALPPDNMAVERFRKALDEEKRPQSYTWRRRFLEGELAETDGHIPEALALYRQSAAMVQRERNTISDEKLRGSFVTDKLDLYDRLILNLLNLRQFDEAFQWLEQSRARAMMDMVAKLEVDFKKPAERKLYSDWVAARSRADAEVPDGRKAAAESTEQVLERIRTQAPKLLELGISEPVSFHQMQTALAASGSDLVYFLLHQGRIVLWHIGPTGSGAQAYYAPVSQLQGLAGRVVNSASSHRDFDQQAAEQLYFYLAQPALEVMETKHLIVIPPPELSGLPFQALFDKAHQQFLGEQVALSTAPSGSLVATLQPAQALRPANVLLVVGPGLTTEGREAEAIAAKYPRHKILRGGNATFENLSQEAKGRTAVHLAAHGSYNGAAPMLSDIGLPIGSDKGARTTAAQMLSLPLEGVRIVTLGSCNTGNTSVDAGNESYGFVRSLLYAGAQSAILPLWEVPDDGSAFWFEAFYSMAETHDLPEAARLANVAARRHGVYGSHPRYWAGYQFVGH